MIRAHGPPRPVTTALAAFAVALAACVLWLGGACFGGRFLVDPSRMIDTYHLATIYARFGAYVGDGFFPWWFPDFALGVPVPSMAMYGLLYPPTLLYAVLPVETAWAWLAALHVALGAFGMAGFLREETDDSVAAAVGAVLFAGSAFVMTKVLTGHTNVVFPLAWVPVVLWQVARCRRGARGAAPLLAAALALGLLSGHVQTWFYCGPLVLAYAALRTADARPARARSTAAIALAALVAAGVTAVQWVPAVAITRMGAAPEFDPALVAAWSPQAHTLAAGAVPGFLGRIGHDAWSGAEYPNELIGVSGFAFVLLGALALRRGDRDGWFWLAVALAGLAIASGPHTAVGRALGDLPVLAWSRTPGRAQMLTLLAGCVLAARGVARWRALPPTERRRPALVAAAATAAAALVVAWVVHGWVATLPATLSTAAGATTWDAVWRGIALPAVLRETVVVAALAGALFVARREGAVAWALPGVLLVAALAGGMPRAETAPAAFFHHDWVARLPAAAQGHRVALLDWRWPPVELDSALTTRRTSHVEPPAYDRLVHAGRLNEIWPWLDVGMLLERQEGVSPARVPPGSGVTARLPPRPPKGRVRWFASAVTGVSDADALAEILAGGDRLLLADTPPPPPATPGPQSTTPGPSVHIAEQPDPDRVAIDVESPLPGWVLLADKHYPGWTATVDGAPVAISRAMVALRAVPVPAGRHRIEMRYEPAPVRTSLPVSVLSLAVLAAWGVRVLVTRGRAPA